MELVAFMVRRCILYAEHPISLRFDRNAPCHSTRPLHANMHPPHVTPKKTRTRPVVCAEKAGGLYYK